MDTGNNENDNNTPNLPTEHQDVSQQQITPLAEPLQAQQTQPEPNKPKQNKKAIIIIMVTILALIIAVIA